MLEAQDARRAISRALEREGIIMEARIAMIAITVRSSIKVKARRLIENDPENGSVSIKEIPQKILFFAG